MARLNLTAGVPAVIAITRAGESVPSTYTKGGYDVLFKTADGDALYVDPERAGDIEREMQQLGIGYGDQMQLTKHKTSHGGHAYRVERLRQSEVRGNAYRDSAERVGAAPAARTASAGRTSAINERSEQSKSTPAPPAPAMSTATSCMCSAMMAAVDAAIETQAYAARKGLGLTFSEESVRAIGLSIYISACKGGR